MSSCTPIESQDTTRLEVCGFCHPFAGPIRLQQGIPGSRGFGKFHIETHPGRLEQIRRLGFASCEDYVREVAAGYQWIGRADEADKLMLVFRHQEHDLRLVIRWEAKTFWSVVTGLPYRVARIERLLTTVDAEG
jgi:hypothetical protein